MKRALAWIAVTVVTALLWPGWASAAPVASQFHADNGNGLNVNGVLPPGWKNTQWGLYGPGDQALLDNVRRANIWEGQIASVLGMQKGTTQRVREVGKALHDQHAVLEAQLQKVADQLEVLLPTQPNGDQQSWINDMQAANGKSFDQVWVDRLRAAHGKIFSIIATVRANTRNSIVRDYAIAANNAVALHMSLLESTGLVSFNQLPTPAAPPPTNTGFFSTSNRTNSVPPFVWVVLAAGVLGCVAAAVRLVRTR